MSGSFLSAHHGLWGDPSQAGTGFHRRSTGTAGTGDKAASVPCLLYGSRRAAKSTRIGCWPLNILRSASSRLNHPARSTSGNSFICPDFGGHSIRNVLLTMAAMSISASIDQASTRLPPGWRYSPSHSKSPSILAPTSSKTSRFAADSSSSPSSTRPLGMDHAPRPCVPRTARRAEPETLPGIRPFAGRSKGLRCVSA